MVKKYLFWFSIAIMASFLIREINFLIKTGSDLNLFIAIGLIALLIIASLILFLNTLHILSAKQKKGGIQH